MPWLWLQTTLTASLHILSISHITSPRMTFCSLQFEQSGMKTFHSFTSCKGSELYWKSARKSVLHRNTLHRENKCNIWQNDRQKQEHVVFGTTMKSVTDSGSLWETPHSKQWNLELHRRSQETVDQDCPLIHYHRHCKLVSYKLEVHWSGTSNRPPHETG